MEELPREHQKLVADLIPGQIAVGGVQRVLQGLLAERISIRDLPTVLEGIQEACASGARAIPAIVSHVRARLADTVRGIGTCLRAPAMKPETAFPQMGTIRTTARAPSRRTRPAPMLKPRAPRNSATSRALNGRPVVWMIIPTMSVCSVVRIGMSASGIGWTPMTPQTALKDFSRDPAICAWARRAFVRRANSSCAGSGRAAQIASTQAGSSEDGEHAGRGPVPRRAWPEAGMRSPRKAR